MTGLPVTSSNGEIILRDSGKWWRSCLFVCEGTKKNRTGVYSSRAAERLNTQIYNEGSSSSLSTQKMRPRRTIWGFECNFKGATFPFWLPSWFLKGCKVCLKTAQNKSCGSSETGQGTFGLWIQNSVTSPLSAVKRTAPTNGSLLLKSD